MEIDNDKLRDSNKLIDIDYFKPDYYSQEQSIYKQLINFIGFKTIHLKALLYVIPLLYMYEINIYICLTLMDIYQLYTNFSKGQLFLVNIMFFVGLIVGNLIYEFFMAKMKSSFIIDHAINIYILLLVIFLITIENFVISLIARLLLGICLSMCKPKVGVIIVELFQSKINQLILMILYASGSINSLIMIIIQFISTPNYELNKFYKICSLVIFYNLFLYLIFKLIDRSVYFSEKVIFKNNKMANKIYQEELYNEISVDPNYEYTRSFIYKEISFPLLMRKMKQRKKLPIIYDEFSTNKLGIEKNEKEKDKDKDKKSLELDLLNTIKEEGDIVEESVHVSSLFSDENLKYTIFNCIGLFCGYYNSYTYTVLNNTISKLSMEVNETVKIEDSFNNDIIVNKLILIIPNFLSGIIFAFAYYFDLVNRKISAIIFVSVTILFQILSVVNLKNVLIYSTIANAASSLSLIISTVEILYSFNIIIQNIGSNFCFKIGRVGIILSVTFNLLLKTNFTACMIISIIINVIYLIMQIFFPERKNIH